MHIPRSSGTIYHQEVIELFRKFSLGRIAVCLLVLSILLNGCMSEGEKNVAAQVPEIPQKLQLNDDDVPMLKVYDTKTESVEEMDIETYLMGVVAGEMKNDWPIEALKAQAILARTFTMRFIADKDSRYENADISTDIHEAQAYDAKAINENIREAVNDTRGIVMASNGEFPHAWFHAHSGGRTELPTKALEFKEDPDYLSVVESKESANAPEDVKNWVADFTKEEILNACRDTGHSFESIESFEMGERGDSGRAISFLVNGESVSAPGFRVQIGASKLKSTLIDTIEMKDGGVVFTGRGYGHGVGMSQWGAYQMAEDGKNCEEIIRHYYTGVELVELW